jgi:HAD superfamily phosphoserine phosphatase-like hydrolase
LAETGLIPDLYADEGLRLTREAHERGEKTVREYDAHWVQVMHETYARSRLSRADFTARARVVAQELIDARFEFTWALFEAFREAGYAVILISQAPHELVHVLAELVGAHHAIGNVMETDGQGVFIGRDHRNPVKDEDARAVACEFGYDLARAFAVGDSINDIPMLRLARTAIAFNPGVEMLDALDKTRSGALRVTEADGVIKALQVKRTYPAQASDLSPCRITDYLPTAVAHSTLAKLTAIGYSL